jgi:hypothetical protein
MNNLVSTGQRWRSLNLAPVQPSGQVQEFLIHDADSIGEEAAPVPETGNNLLIGLGLVSLSCFWSDLRM